ncbi:MAG: FAD:protein FMN transferase, partial [Planctomycetota bacterium]
NRLAATLPVSVGKETFGVLSEAKEIAQMSGGALDVTIHPLMQLWHCTTKEGRLPSSREIEAALGLVAHSGLSVDPNNRCVQLQHPGMGIDLGGIAKGYAAQAGVERMRELGLPICLVSLAGDVAAGEAPPGARGWTIVAEPEQRGAMARRLLIVNGAASTSGDTFQFVEIGGVRYSHIIDPRTGLGMKVRRSVTTVGVQGAIVDGVATALTILGRERALELCTRFHVAAIVSEGGEDGGNAETFDPFGLLVPAP